MKQATPTPDEPLLTIPHAATISRVLRGVAWGIVPVLFVGFFLTNVEGEMTFVARLVALAQRLLMILLACVTALVAGLFGMRLLGWMRITPARLFTRFLFGVGLGLGTLSLATLGLGCAGAIGPAASGGILGVMFLVGVGELRGIGDFLRRKDRPAARPLSLYELLLVFVCLAPLLFQLTLAFNLPMDYDACEYHVAAPARWFQVGRIDFIVGNVFSNFPMNCEMLYLFSMGLTNDLMLGIHLSVVMNALTAVLAAGAVYALARRLWSRRSALAATALFATTPLAMIYSVVNVYNEMFLAFYLALAVHTFLEFVECREERWVVLSAVFAGLASGVKYTAFAFLPIVLGVSVALVARGRPRRRIGLALLYMLIVVAVFLPWLVRGIPVFELWDDTPPGAAEWLAGQHEAAGADRAGAPPVAVWQRVVAHPFGSLAIAGFLVLGVAMRPERTTWWLVVFLALWTLFWYAFTHRVGRFWMPMVPIAAALAGRGTEVLRGRRVRMIVAAVLLGALGYYLHSESITWRANATGTYNLKTGNDRVLQQNPLFPLYVFARSLKPTDHLMMIGEAQSLYLPPNVSYSTVFDEEVLGRTLSGHGSYGPRLRRAGVTHIFVNWAEMTRLNETYTRRPSEVPLPLVLQLLEREGALRDIPLPEVGPFWKEMRDRRRLVLYKVVGKEKD